jgi:diaminopimelate epimerase
MVLLNADGSRAEMSGNGIGCLVQAAVLAGLVEGPLVRVATDAGIRAVEIVVPEGGAHEADAVTVGMGPVSAADDPAWAVDGIDRALRVEVGNPHLVLLPADAALVRDREWLTELGAKANATIAGGVNLEVIAGTAGGTGAIDMDVYERGVGLTDACGTGAVAAAVAARHWGLVADDVAVTMHGGTVGVALAGDEPSLTTTITYVGAVEYPW